MSAVHQLKDYEVEGVEVIKPKRPAFFDAETLPWTPWVMEGTYFRLLNVNPVTGGFTNILKVDPGMEAPIHHHLGAIEGYIIEGEFGYDDDRGGKGSFVFEEPNSIHKPDTPGGFTMFAVNYGPLMGYNPDGSISAIIDAKAMYEMAKANGAADHLAHYYED